MKQTTVVSKLFKYFFQNRDDVARAIEEFFGLDNLGPNGEILTENENEEALFMDWITFDFRFSGGKNLIEKYLSDETVSVNKEDRNSLENMLLNKYGFFEVKDFLIDKWMDLESLQSGKIYHVREKLGTKSAFVGQILLCRVGKVNDDEWMMIGSNPISIPANFGGGFGEMLRGTNFTPIDARRLVADR